MELSLSESAVDLMHSSIGNPGRASPVITTTTAGLCGSDIRLAQSDGTSDMRSVSLSSPPNSSASPSPSPSVDLTQCSTSSSVSSLVSTPRQQCVSSVLSNKASTPSSYGMFRLHSTPGGQLTPMVRLSSPAFTVPHIFDDQSRQQPGPEASSSLRDLPKRSAESPLRPRSHTLVRERPQSMIILPKVSVLGASELSQPEDFFEQHNRHAIQSYRTPVSSSDSHPFWDNSEDPVELEGSNKRPKNELRGAAGRKARSAAWGSTPRARLTKHSTMSMIAGVSLKEEPGEEQEVGREGSHVSSSSTSTVCEDTEDQLQRTPTKSERRQPLIETSGDLDVDNLARYDRFMYMAPDSPFSVDRPSLVLWVIGICYQHFDYKSSTVHAAVHIMDRYLITKGSEITVADLQAIGICAAMIAGKLDETSCTVNVERCLVFCSYYTSKHLAKTELAILAALKFEILVASANGFADYFKRAIPAIPQVLVLFDALWIALCAVHRDWNEELAIFTGYTRVDLTPCSIIFKEAVDGINGDMQLKSRLQEALGPQYPLTRVIQTLSSILER
ncbi:Cyclin-A1 [Mortierella claussenii]|nr:Cyclin-A1 [Mortierella claussenii]